MKKQENGQIREKILKKLERFQEGNFSQDDVREISGYFNDPRYSLILQEGLSRLWERELRSNMNGESTPKLEETLKKLHQRIQNDMKNSTE